MSKKNTEENVRTGLELAQQTSQIINGAIAAHQSFVLIGDAYVRPEDVQAVYATVDDIVLIMHGYALEFPRALVEASNKTWKNTMSATEEAPAVGGVA